MTDTQTEQKHGEVDKKHEHEDHEDDKNDIEGVEGDHKQTRGEKKFKKAMGKMGLKPVTGINRVTIKRGKAVFFLSNVVRYQH